MSKKDFSKRYLISSAVLFFAGGALIFLLLLSLNGKGSIRLSTVQILLTALASAVFALGSYTGFVLFGERAGRMESLNKKIIVSLCVFFPVTLALLTIFGIIMIIPAVIKAAVSLKNDEV